MRYACVLFFLLQFTVGRAQNPFPSPERFINDIIPKVIDSTGTHYFLVVGADSCRFVKYKYDEWADYHLAEPIPISVLNELAEKVYLSRYHYYWKQDSLTKATCVTHRQADSILYLNPPGGAATSDHYVFSFSLPQFTDDGKYAVIDLNLICGGACGVGTTYIFHLYPAGWKVVGEYTNWEMRMTPTYRIPDR
jgi:hypothetical protein